MEDKDESGEAGRAVDTLFRTATDEAEDVLAFRCAVGSKKSGTSYELGTSELMDADLELLS